MRLHPTPQPVKEAQKIARQHGMFAVDKGVEFLLYRKTPTRPVYLGKSADARAFLSLVTRCATVK